MSVNLDKAEWFGNARLGLFIHWGLYSILGRGEWVMYRDRIPKNEYAKLAMKFNPRNFDPEKWCRSAKNAGLKYAVLTTCHHDGFALFDSKADDFNSMRTAAKCDFVAEFVKACRKHDLGVGLYYSLGDWRFGIMKESDSAEAAAKMVELTHAQISELMSNYGKIDILWYDGGWCYPSTPHDTQKDVRKFWKADELNAMVRKLQPEILINDRSGKSEDFRTLEGHVNPGHNEPREESHPNPGLKRDSIWEACLTMGADDNSYWGYVKHCPWRKSQAQLIQLLVTAVSKGGNVLLNVGPDADGVIPCWQQRRLDILGKWIGDNAESVYGVQHSVVTEDLNGIQGSSAGRCAEKGDILYFYIFNWPGKEAVIPVMKRKIVRAILLKSGKTLKHEKDACGRLIITGLPDNPPDPYCNVVKLEMSGDHE
jgi:alpha-L-fucosidase